MKMPEPSFDARIVHLNEPDLEFRHGQRLVYPRDGLYLFGPVEDTASISYIRYGVIGTHEGVRRFRRWAKTLSSFIPVPELGSGKRPVSPHHVPFPGFGEAFHAEWPIIPSTQISSLNADEIGRSLRISNRHEAIRNVVDLFVTPLIEENNRNENPPAFWFVVIPEEIYIMGRPESKVKIAERVKGKVAISRHRAQRLVSEPTFFGDDELQADVYKYATNFRRQLKARLLKEKIVTQIVRETTLTPDEFLQENGLPLRRIEDPATVAWKLGTGAYYKAGGRPWQLADVRPGVCYVGLVYKRTDLTNDVRHACCAAQMFLTNGDGVVFRGALGPWFQTDTKRFHINENAARNLVRMVVEEYGRLQGESPRELFIHAQAAFTDEEWHGFRHGVDKGTKLVGVQIVDGWDDLKLFRPGAYPVIRGTALVLSSHHAYIWTSGYVPRLDTYMGPETPNPISVRVLRGDCELMTVLQDVMALTKINFNSCIHNDRLPVTINFANAVGDVLMSAPMDSEPKLPFKFYI